MVNNPRSFHRRSIRLKGYDYTQPGAYFITVCTNDRQLLFGDIADGVMHLNRLGLIVQRAWLDLSRHYPNVILDAVVIMPNHVHGVIVLVDDGPGGETARSRDAIAKLGKGGSDMGGQIPGAQQNINPPESSREDGMTRPYNAVANKRRHGLPEIVRAFKSFSAKRINAVRRAPGQPVWQRNYYEHIVRNEAEWDDIRAYIENNPLDWDGDVENPLITRRGGS